MQRSPNPSQWLNFDALAVLVFVMIGRDHHASGESVAGTLRTMAPFLVAMVVGWAIARAWRTPDSLRTGLITWGTTVALGMLLRHFVWGRGTALTFIIVATVFLGLTMMTWRFVSRSVHRRLGGGGH